MHMLMGAAVAAALLLSLSSCGGSGGPSAYSGGVVAGKVTDTDGAALSGVTVTVSPAGSAPMSTGTASDGSYSVRDVPGGTGLVDVSDLPARCTAPVSEMYQFQPTGNVVFVDVEVMCGSEHLASVAYISNHHGNAITVYPEGAVGDVAPIRVIAGTHTLLDQPTQFALAADGTLYVPNQGSGTVTVYAPDAKDDATPIRTLTASGLTSPVSVAVDSSGALWVVDGTTNKVFHFPAEATDSDFFLTTESGLVPGTKVNGVALDETGALYVGNDLGEVSVYAPGATSTATFSTRSGTACVLMSALQVAGSAFTCATNDVPVVYLYAAPVTLGAGDTSIPQLTFFDFFPVLSTSVPVGTASFGGLALDEAGDHPVLYATDKGSGRNAVYRVNLTETSTGGGTVLAVESATAIVGSHTLLDEPWGIAVVH